MAKSAPYASDKRAASTGAAGPGAANTGAERPVLELSGPRLRAALEVLVTAAENIGGIEQFVDAVKLKSKVFNDLLGAENIHSLQRDEFEQLAQLMATVRRRIGPLIDREGWPTLHGAIVRLLDGASDTTTANARITAFVKTFADKKENRFVRDLASEILHNVLPEHYPMMNRWVWDTKANTGVLREIWYGDNVDHMVIHVDDGYETFLMLREELSQFLAENGVFRDMLWHVDLLQAQVYADYIGTQGGAYLKADFVRDGDPLEHTRRIVGLDRVAARRAGKSKTLDGTAQTVPAPKLLS